MHFLIIAGIIAMAVGIEEMVLDSDEPLPTATQFALAAGIVLYLGATDLARFRATRRVLPARNLVGVVLAALVLVLHIPALPMIAIVAIGLGVIAAVEGIRKPSARHR